MSVIFCDLNLFVDFYPVQVLKENGEVLFEKVPHDYEALANQIINLANEHQIKSIKFGGNKNTYEKIKEFFNDLEVEFLDD